MTLALRLRTGVGAESGWERTCGQKARRPRPKAGGPVLGAAEATSELAGSRARAARTWRRTLGRRRPGCPAPPRSVCQAWMVSELRVDAESRPVGPSRHKLGARPGVAPGWLEAPLHSQLPGSRAQKARNAGQPLPRGFQRRPRRKRAGEWFGSKYPFLLPVGSSAHKELRALAAGSLGHRVPAARPSVPGIWCSWWVLAVVVYFTAFLALFKSVTGRSLRERRPTSFGWVHCNSNPVISFSSTTGFQCPGTHGRRQGYAVCMCTEMT